MEFSMLDFIFRNQSMMARVPVRLVQGQKTLAAYTQYKSPLRYFDDALREFGKAERKAQYLLSKELLQFGIVRDMKSDRSVLLGPIRLTKLSDAELQSVATANGVPLNEISEFRDYMNSLSLLSHDRVIQFLQIMYAVINGEPIGPEEIWSPNPEYDLQTTVNRDLITIAENVAYGEKLRHQSYDFEEEMLFYISHGMVDRLKALSTESLQDTVGRTASNDLRHYKNIVLISNSLCSRSAIKGGLNSEIAYSLAEIYARKIELCSSANELQPLSRQIRLDYCTRVRELKYAGINDLTVNRAMKYILEHVTEKIVAKDIADTLHISTQYLSAKFKEVTGTGVVEFINKSKISEAEYLLTFTEEPLVRISNFLSFSSQSYFQSIFKKYTGLTPTEYRAKNKADFR